MKTISREEVLSTYEKTPRVLTPEFISQIRWKEVKNHPIPTDLVSTIAYMRDIERAVGQYAEDMRKTSTGRDPHIKRFLDRWSEEEIGHGDILNRFLAEAGLPTDDKYYERVLQKIPLKQHFRASVLQPLVAKIIGKRFSAVHMVWGAINEFSTLNSYLRLRDIAKHPVLSDILFALMKEEAQHANFYFFTAGLDLKESPFAQTMSRFLVERFWKPVGQGIKTPAEAEAVIRSIYQSESDVDDHIDRRVTRQIERLPGYEGFNRTTEAVKAILGLNLSKSLE